MINKIRKLLLPLIIIIAGFSSCYPIDDLAVEDLDVAVTLYDSTYYNGPEGSVNKFENLRTFVVVDTIVHIVESGTTDNISRQYDAFVLEQVRLNMLKLGFEEETNPEVNSDVAITVSALTSTHEVYMWYPYWGWYWGYGGVYPYAGKGTLKITSVTPYYYYPWYPYSSSYSYQSGSVLMEMVDVVRVDPNVEKIPVIWAGIVNGVLESSQSGVKNRLSKGIDQCFVQSPYLLKNIE